MKKILVTTDFSKNSRAAIDYAAHLANELNANLELFNSFVTVPSIGIDGGPSMMNENVLDAGINHNKVRLDEVLKEIPEKLSKDIFITTKVAHGDPVLTICEYANDNDFDLIVMGTQGENRFEELLFGSTSVEVMKRASCPVLAIPPDSKYLGVGKIVYATDLEERDIDVINDISEFADMFGAEIVIFHAFGEDNMTAQEEADQFNEMLSEKVSYEKIKKESLTYANSHDAILEVVKKDLANMVVMREKKRGIFSRLFHPDMVKRINYHTTIPLMVYNENSI